MKSTLPEPTDRTGTDLTDSSGRGLTDYPRPSVAVDTAVLTVAPAADGGVTLAVLQVRRAGSHRAGAWALPGTFLHPGERLIDAVARSLRDKAGGIDGAGPRQLHVFDDPTRDDRGWVLSVAHVDLVRYDQVAEAVSARPDLRLAPVAAPGRLPYDHRDIVRHAVQDVRNRYTAAPDPDRFRPRTFTLRQLRLVHEAVAGRPLQRDTFRRAMQDHLVATGRMSTGSRGRPAELFRRR